LDTVSTGSDSDRVSLRYKRQRSTRSLSLPVLTVSKYLP
jgi:hypothetical protein